MCSDLRGSFSSDGSPANISCSSARTTAPRYDRRERQRRRSSPSAPRRGSRSRIAVNSSCVAHGAEPTGLSGYEPSTIACIHRPFTCAFGRPACPVPSSSRPPARRSASCPARSPAFAAMDLGGFAIKAAPRPRRGRRRPGRLRDHGPGAAGRPGQITARQAAVKARHPDDGARDDRSTRCASRASTRIYLADQMIQAGDAEIVVAGGMESMTNAPYLLPKAREGYRMGNGELRRRADPRRPVVRVRRRAHGLGHRALHGRVRRHHPRGSGRVRGQEPRARRRRA